MMMCNSFGHLKLFFTTYAAMMSVIDRILTAQGFEHRLDQYRRIEQLPDALVCERGMAASKYCEAVQFELKGFDKSDQDNLHVFN